MRFTVITIFPEMFESVLAAGVVGRGRAAGAISVDFIDPRDFTQDRHRTVDDSPYGGGPGMVMKVEPLVAAIEAASVAGETAAPCPPPYRVLLSPRGQPLGQSHVRALAEREHIVLVCGRYEGIDERVSRLVIDEELSVGDYVLSGGEIAAMTVIDAVARYAPGVLGEVTSTEEESFTDSLLEYPQYTRPAQYRGLAVPEILVSGHHGNIADWRRTRSLALTAERRPDLWARHRLDERDQKLWETLPDAERGLARRTYVALVHHPVYDRDRNIVTTALTNLDLHDIARSSATYGLAGYHLVTPVAAQREKAERMVQSWQNGEQGTERRIEALALIRVAASLDETVTAIATLHGRRPRVVATSARERGQPIGFAALASQASAERDRPLLLVFGTGHGLSDELINKSDQILMPIRGHSASNHLSVRSAVAVVLDRLFGLREDQAGSQPSATST